MKSNKIHEYIPCKCCNSISGSKLTKDNEQYQEHVLQKVVRVSLVIFSLIRGKIFSQILSRIRVSTEEL
jgi:hypothetical protein